MPTTRNDFRGIPPAAVRDGFAVMCDGTQTGSTEMTEPTAPNTEKVNEPGEQQEQGKTFTQAEVDALVRQRAERVAKQLYPDYDELKTKAAGAQTLEERLGTLEQELNATRAQALRSSIAARFGISTEKGKDGEPSDADLFLTGTDESTLTAQAQRLAARQVETKKQGNVAPKEGDAKTTGKTDSDLREFTRGLFNRAE